MSNILRWELWVKGIIAAFITGAANAITNMIVAPDTFNFVEGKRKLIESAVVSGLVGAALYLKQSPLPKLQQEEKEVQP